MELSKQYFNDVGWKSWGLLGLAKLLGECHVQGQSRGISSINYQFLYDVLSFLIYSAFV